MRVQKTDILLLLCFGCLLFFLLGNCDASLVRNKRSDDCHTGNRKISPGGVELLQLRTEVYNGTYNDTDGKVVKYSTLSYRTNEKCKLIRYTDDGYQLVMTSEYFALEDSDNCMFDYLELNPKQEGPGNKFCGWKPLTYITSTYKTYVTFSSDESYEDRGYKFLIRSQKVDEVTFCNNTIIGDKYPKKMISNPAEGKNCFYRIEAEGDKLVQLTLQELNFGSRPCSEQSVIIYAGHSTHGRKLTEICSDTTPRQFSYREKAYFIEYRNPLDIEQEDAFKIKYVFVEDNLPPTTVKPLPPSPVGGDADCSGMFINLNQGNLTYTSPYQVNNKHCIVVVRNTLLRDHVVQIKFLYFETEESDDCVFDYLKIFSGERNESLTLGGPYCGESLDGRIFVTSGNSLRLEFKTDESFALRGFKAFITFEPAYDCLCEGNRICVQQGYEKLCKRGQRCRNANCQNGGTCVEHAGDKHCYCKAGFEGDDCSVNSASGTIQHLRFKEAPIDRHIQEGQSINPDCQLNVSRNTEVRYQWTLNGAPIGDYNSKSGFGAHPGGLLAIDNFKEEFEGQYACIATTALGVAEHTFQYRMVSNCQVNIYPGPGSLEKNVGQSALLPCYAKPLDKIKIIIWKKNGIPVDYTDGRFEKKANNYLEIRDIKLTDKGSYSCHAEDVNGCIMSKSGSLTVLDYQPLKKYCGISTWDEDIIQSRLSQATAARVNENPWHVNLRTNPKDKPAKTFCGGTLISRKYVLTAAHCIDEFENNFKIGAFGPSTVNIYFGTTDCLGGGTKRSVRNFSMHPKYNNRTKYDNDIALIELNTPVEYGDSIRPICLAEAGFVEETFLEKKLHTSLGRGSSGRVVGCGRRAQRGGQHANLQMVHLPYVAREDCEETLENIRKVKYSNTTLTNSMFCAGSKVARTGDACQGDSGGGFVMATDDRWVLTGIVSWGVGCDKANFYGVYTNVGVFYDWIKRKSKFDEEQVENFLKERQQNNN